MLQIFKRDFLMYRAKIFVLFPVMSVSLIFMFPEADEGYFVMGLPLVFMLSILLFVQDDVNKGLQLLVNQPISRQQIARGRFISAWLFMVLGVIYIILLGLLMSIAYPAARAAFLSFVNLNTLVIYLWFLTVISFVAFPILYAFLGRGLQAIIILVLGLNMLLGVFFFFGSESGGANLYKSLEQLILNMNRFHHGILSYTVSLLVILALNLINMRVCEWVLQRKEF